MVCEVANTADASCMQRGKVSDAANVRLIGDMLIGYDTAGWRGFPFRTAAQQGEIAAAVAMHCHALSRRADVLQRVGHTLGARCRKRVVAGFYTSEILSDVVINREYEFAGCCIAS